MRAYTVHAFKAKIIIIIMNHLEICIFFYFFSFVRSLYVIFSNQLTILFPYTYYCIYLKLLIIFLLDIIRKIKISIIRLV